MYNRIQSLVQNKVLPIKRKAYLKKEENCFRGKKQLAHIVYLGGNMGDIVLGECVRRTADTLEQTPYRWKIVNVRQPVTESLISLVNETSGIILGGGGLFLPDANKNEISGWQWAISKEQLSQIKVPLIVYAVGYNYFRGQEPEPLFCDSIKTLVERADFVGLRNRGSINAVSSILGNDGAEKIDYQPCSTTCIRKLYSNILPSKKKTGKIAMNIAFDREKLRFGNNKDLIMTQLAETAKEIHKRGYQIVYIMHCKGDSQFIPYLNRVGVDYKLIDLAWKNPLECIRIYNEIDVVLGMRGHSQMIPFGVNSHIISLGSHDKMKWFLEDIDALDWYEDVLFEPENLRERLSEKFIKIHETESDLTDQRLLEKQEKLWNLTNNNWKKIHEIINLQ